MSLDCNIATAEPQRHAEVFEELKKAGEKQSGWGKGLLLLVASLAAFVAIGFTQWSSWETLALLVAVLFVHELGHYLAMRVFKYRNVRMFFIPFLGAAVIGRNYNVPGWKKVVVSLMGPVPGILIGAILGTIGLALHNALLIKIGLMAVIINGFNLLPVLPLDGGWVAHAVLFSRHHALDCAFRIFAGLGLIAIGIAMQAKLLAYISIPILFSIVLAYKLARISTALKGRALPQASPDDQTIPTETALAIIDEVKRELPTGQTPKSVAQHTLHIFETLNAKPPGWVVSTVLMSVHGGALLMAVVFALLFYIGQSGSLSNYFAAVASAPRQLLKVETLSQVKRGDSFDGPTITVIGDCAGDEQAARAFGELGARVPAQGGIRLFGKTILVALPSSNEELRQQWLDNLQPHATNVFVASSNFVASMSMVCLAQSISNAISIFDETDAYFSVRSGHWQLIPPWDGSDRRSAAERRAHQVARQTYKRVSQAGADTYGAPEVMALRKKLGNAWRQGDRVLANTLEDDERRLASELERRAIEKLRGEGDKVNVKVIDLYTSLPKNFWTNAEAKVIFQEMGRYMGQVPTGAARLAASGNVERNNLLLSFHWVNFDNVFDGAPALAQWLHNQGCIDLRYQFHALGSVDALGE